MKVSRPQDLMYPVEKWGSPAAKVGGGSSGGGTSSADSGGNGALPTADRWIGVPRARHFTRSEPRKRRILVLPD